MNVYTCVWCGCVLKYKDDVCFEHTIKLDNLRGHIKELLNENRAKYQTYKYKVVLESRIIGNIVETQLSIDKARREKERQQQGEMSDEQQQDIFRALGIAV